MNFPIRSLLMAFVVTATAAHGQGLSDLPVPQVGLPPPGDGKERPFLVMDSGGHTAAVKAAFFHPNGENVVTVSADRSVRLWDLAGGEILQVYRFPTEAGRGGLLYAGAIAPDGTTIAVAGWTVGTAKEGTLIYMLSLETGQVATTIQAGNDAINCVEFSRDGQWLASAGHDRLARVHDLKTGKTTQVFQGHKAWIRKVAFSHDHRFLATTGADGTARIWSVADGKAIAVLDDFTDSPLGLAWHPTENTVAIGCSDGTVRLVDADGKLKRTIRIDPTENIKSVALAFSADGTELLYGGIAKTGRAGIFNLKDGKLRTSFLKHNNLVRDAAYSPDGKQAVTTGGNDQETYVWDVTDGKVVQTLRGAGRGVWSLAWRSDGRAFAWGNTSTGDPMKGYRPANPEHTFLFDTMQTGGKPDQDYHRAPFQGDGWELPQHGPRELTIVKDGKPLHKFSVAFPEQIYRRAVLAGDRAVLGTPYGPTLIDLKRGKGIRRFRGHNEAVMALAVSPDGKHFLTGSTDQTISLWDPDRLDPLVTFFMVERDWIAWTPQGYYTCSAYGERLMGWQINHGRDRLATFHPAARFRASLYQPNLLRYLCTEKSFEKALALASQDRTEPIRPVSVAAVLPPVVAVVAPTGAAATVKGTTVQVKVRARSSGGHAITSMRLLVDGRPYQGDKGLKKLDPPAKGEIEIAWTVDLLPGKHAIAAVAESAVSKGVSPWVEVTRVGVPAEELPNLNVLAVGISAYPGPLALRYAHKDAIVLEKTLRAGEGGAFRTVTTRLLTDEKATRQGIVDGLDWLQKQAKATDVTVVFLAGHGSRDARGQFHFIPVDVNQHDLEGTAVSGEVLKKALTNLRGRVVVILDACHSGAASKLKRALADDLVRDLVGEDAGVVVMCSSQGSEYSLESPKVAHGFYTLGLVEALSGRADFNSDRYVYLHEVDFYAYHRVRQLSDGAQNPTTGRPAGLRSFPLAKVK